MTKVERGIVAGLAATVPMTVTMGVLQTGTHPTDRTAPSEVVHRAEKMINLDQEIGETAHETLTGVAHFAFGAAAGAHFGLAGPFTHPVLAGFLYGASIYGASYIGVLPKLNLMPAPQTDRPQRQSATLVSHLVWGVALGGVYGLLGGQKK